LNAGRRRFLSGAAFWLAAIPGVRAVAGPEAASERDPTVGVEVSGGRSGPIPFWIDRRFHIRVDVTINGVPASAIIDSGAGRSVLDQGFADRQGLAQRDGFSVAGVTGATTGTTVDRLEVQIGSASIRGISAGVLNLNAYSTPGDRTTDLIIGRDLFDDVAVSIDFERSTIELAKNYRNSAPRSPGDALDVGPRGTPYIDIEVGDRTLSAAFDLGYNGSLILSPDFVAETGLLVGRRVSTIASAGAEGMSISRLSTIPRIGIAGQTLHDVPLEIPATWARPRPGIVGLDILKRFRITTDYRRRRVWLDPIAALSSTPIPRDRSGIGATPNGSGLVVIHVAEGSPAQMSGLKVGDLIATINGERVDLPYILSHPRMGAQAAGTRYALGLGDGRILTVVLADYF
jgi:predicted aspartyl protease